MTSDLTRVTSEFVRLKGSSWRIPADPLGKLYGWGGTRRPAWAHPASGRRPAGVRPASAVRACGNTQSSDAPHRMVSGGSPCVGERSRRSGSKRIHVESPQIPMDPREHDFTPKTAGAISREGIPADPSGSCAAGVAPGVRLGPSRRPVGGRQASGRRLRSAPAGTPCVGERSRRSGSKRIHVESPPNPHGSP